MSINSLYIPSSPSPGSPLHLSTNINDILNHSKTHFSSLWSSSPSFTSTPLSSYIPTLPPTSISSLDFPISPEELYEAIKSKKDHSAPGPDGLPYKFYKTFPTQISKILIPIFNSIAFQSTPRLYIRKMLTLIMSIISVPLFFPTLTLSFFQPFFQTVSKHMPLLLFILTSLVL